MKIELDINNPGTPLPVLHSLLASTISTQCQEWGIEIPESLKPFVNENDLDVGFNWEEELVKASYTMPLELLTRWVGVMPGGMFREEMRAILRERIESYHGQ